MMSSRAPSGARPCSPSISAATKNSASANAAQAFSSIGRRENWVMPSLANSRYASSVIAERPTPTIGGLGGQQAVDVQVVERGQQLAVRQVAAAAEDDDRHDAFFTAWPPN